VSQGFLVIGVSRSHSGTPHSIGLLSPTQRAVIENKQHSGETDIHDDPVGFVPAIPGYERSQIHALERTAIRIGKVDIKEIITGCLGMRIASRAWFSLTH
jgi:hypothetical protein